MDKKQTNTPKYSDQNHELEKFLSSILAPVSPRGEFVQQLQNRLESRFDPKPLQIFPSKVWNIVVISLMGLFSGIFFMTVAVKWIKKIIKSNTFTWQCNQKTNKNTDQQTI